MNVLFKAPRGTLDILPQEIKVWQKIKAVAMKVCEMFGFSEIILPTFENKKLFTKSNDESSDIVQKEMFSFKDLGGRELALRPEVTASAARAIIEHGLLNQPLPIKIFYILNCFRNERPQTGRYKEFYQFGVELFGSNQPTAEFEVISLANMFFDELNIKNITLEINSIGCINCRKNYIEFLIKYFEKEHDVMCPDCKNRLIKNPLRILDCKVLQCKNLRKNAPQILDHICDDCKDHFFTVCELLKYNNIPFEINPFVVRGLDYYTRTVFEFKTKSLGSQNTVCGGGRYDGLFEVFGAKKTPSLGFGVGLNRLILLLDDSEKNNNSSECCLFIGNTEKSHLLEISKIAKNLRKLGVSVQFNLLEKSVKAQMKYANKINSSFSCIIGEEEVVKNSVAIKNMNNGENFAVSLKNFEDEFVKFVKI